MCTRWTTSPARCRCVRTRRSLRLPIRARRSRRFGWVQEECTPKLYPAAKGEYMKDVLAEMERLNVTAVVFGDPKGVQKWKDAAPNRVIPGTAFGEWHDARRARSARRVAQGFHHRRIQGNGRDRAAVRGIVAERSSRGPVFRAGGGTRHSGGDPHGHGRIGSREYNDAEVSWLDGQSAAA